jgi:acetyltransferase-like isoleucine patch superfamily enzyme
MLANPVHFKIGAGVQIRKHARLEAVIEYRGKRLNPKIKIGDNCTIEQGMHLACGESVEIGSGVAITEYVGIFDIYHSYQNATQPIHEQPVFTAPVKIGDNTLIGMGAVVQPGVTIGRNCLIGANAVVVRDIPDYSVAVGAPARVVRSYDPTSEMWRRHK